MLRKVGYALFTLIVAILVSTPLVTYWRQKPTLAVTIRSWSMVPLLTRGDMVFIWPTSKEAKFLAGQIVVFGSKDNGIRDWTMHRIVDGDSERGFVTKGDANKRTDQEDMGYPLIRPEWIAGVVPTIGSLPLKIPLLGYIPLLMEENMKNPRLLPVLLGVLASVLLFDGVFKTKKKRKKEALQKGQMYFLCGMTFAVLMGALMLMSSLFLTFPYGVEKTAGALMGSDVGVLELGDSREIALAELRNEGAIPSYYCVVSGDPQVVVHQERYFMRGGDTAIVTATVHAHKQGIYQANVTVGMLMPFLPPRAVSFLAGINFWLALVVVSLVPALPLFVLPYLDPKYRRRLAREIRKRWTRAFEYLPFR